MSKELEIVDLGTAKNKWNKLYFKTLSKGYTLEEIEKQLKALKIIKKKKVNVFWLLEVGNAETYNFAFPKTDRHLTQEEYDLLKEVLK